MEERLIQSRQPYLLDLWSGLATVARETFSFIFPFLFPPSRTRLNRVDYGNRDDFLFISDFLSIKHYAHPATVSLLITGLAVAILLIAIISRILDLTVPMTIVGITALFYASFIAFKLYVTYHAASFAPLDFSTSELCAVTDDELPVYTVFVPLKHEAEVVDQIVAALERIDYPRNKLNIVIALEAYDHATIQALECAALPGHVRLVTMPYIEPQTKPKTLNVIFEELKGEFMVILDAEIIPDSDQLKKAYLAFRSDPGLACLQTRLDHYNARQNALTRLFNMEYAFYYDWFLPGLMKLGFPIPLSGHSTHFRTGVLNELGGWDPYNVTEDCEIGIRLCRMGYRVGILNSVSREEAASTIWSWIKQRTRWMKGFIQTTIVHLRYPLMFKEDIGGWKNFAAFLATVPGTIVLNVLNLVSWCTLALWFLTGSDAIRSWYPTPVLYLSNFVFFVGCIAFVYMNLVSAHQRGRFDLIKYGSLTPLYWMLLAIASTRAVLQIILSPSTHGWEKTTHGTHLAGGSVPVT